MQRILHGALGTWFLPACLAACQGASPPVPNAATVPAAHAPAPSTPTAQRLPDEDQAYDRSLTELNEHRPVALRDVSAVLGREPDVCEPRGPFHAMVCEWSLRTKHGPRRVRAYLLHAMTRPPRPDDPLAAVVWPDEDVDGGAR